MRGSASTRHGYGIGAGDDLRWSSLPNCPLPIKDTFEWQPRTRKVDHDVRVICGPRHARGHDRRGHRWEDKGKIGFHGGKVEIERPRLRSFEGKEQGCQLGGGGWEDWLGKWAMNQMLINVSTRKFARSVRLPEGDVPAPMGSGLSLGRFPPLRGAVGGAHEGVGSVRPLRP